MTGLPSGFLQNNEVPRESCDCSPQIPQGTDNQPWFLKHNRGNQELVVPTKYWRCQRVWLGREVRNGRRSWKSLKGLFSTLKKIVWTGTVSVSVCMSVCITAYVWSSEDNLHGSVLSYWGSNSGHWAWWQVPIAYWVTLLAPWEDLFPVTGKMPQRLEVDEECENSMQTSVRGEGGKCESLTVLLLDTQFVEFLLWHCFR